MSGSGYDLHPPRGPKDKMRRAVEMGHGDGSSPSRPPEKRDQGPHVSRVDGITKESRQ